MFIFTDFSNLKKMEEILTALINEQPIKEVEENGILIVELENTNVIIEKENKEGG